MKMILLTLFMGLLAVLFIGGIIYSAKRGRLPLVLFLLAGCGTPAFAETFTVTAYCPCKKCCGPLAPRQTASGVWPKEGITIAAPRRIPFGTRLHIQGVGVRTVQDRLAPRFDNRIDVYFASHADALRFGKRQLTVKPQTH